ncbi:erythroid membrane-associated protein-like [Polypterus senegalus]|uniref:erythroid membrane-associated protein-like n=1 Tax=Polypterus senegalus TaxID=55291 RepID=UPI001964AE98|nr:erythroid membrane-associated protein-like [Polypterus senegalus]
MQPAARLPEAYISEWTLGNTLKTVGIQKRKCTSPNDSSRVVATCLSPQGPVKVDGFPQFLEVQSDALESVDHLIIHSVTQLSSSAEKSQRVTNAEWRRICSSAADVTFDPETAHPYLIVSEDGKEVRQTDTQQGVMDNPKRFDYCVNVLAREGFTSGRHYWEVEVGGKTDWILGVTRESINRKERITLSPDNGYWTVWLRNENEYEALNYSSVILPLRVKPQTVGVFLDYDEGQVSFYNAQSRSHLYTFTDSFTEPLYPYFSPCNNDGGKNAAPLVTHTLTPLY